MFKWWKRRKDVKKLKGLRKEILEAIASLEVVRNKTTIGELVNDVIVSSSMELKDINLSQIMVALRVVIKEMDVEIDDRTRERKPIFKERVKK